LVETGVTGLKFAPGDERDVASRVRWARRNAPMLDEYGRRARSIYEERYTPEVSFENLIGIYRSVCR
jgi:glycosyltransferase involved in cell wall biosynthesis